MMFWKFSVIKNTVFFCTKKIQLAEILPYTPLKRQPDGKKTAQRDVMWRFSTKWLKIPLKITRNEQISSSRCRYIVLFLSNSKSRRYRLLKNFKKIPKTLWGGFENVGNTHAVFFILCIYLKCLEIF